MRRPDLLVQDVMDGGPGTLVGAGQLAQALPALAMAKHRRTVQLERLPPDVLAFEAGAPHAGAHPLDDPEDPRYSPARGRSTARRRRETDRCCLSRHFARNPT
ncbi:MAG: hypothetical protein WB622_14105 [Acidobacteriaceae bacterium]